VTIAPIIPNLPSAQRAVANKYGQPDSSYTGAQAQTLLSTLNSLPLARAATSANTITPLLQYDLARANNGMSPLTARQSALALRTLATGQPATPPRRQGFFRSAISDLRQMVGMIPKLPGAVINEARQLSDIIPGIQEAIGRADNPLQAVGNVATVPGVRMLPGAFVAEQLLSDQGQGVQGVLAHPLLSALDVLPLAQGAAARTPVVRAAREANDAANVARVQQAMALGNAPGTAAITRPPRPIQTVLTKRLDPATNLPVPNRLGTAVNEATDAFYSTSAGRGIQATFKERALPQLESRYTATLRRMADLETPRSSLPTQLGGRDITPELDLRDRIISVNNQMKAAGIDEARSSELYRLSENPVLPDGTPTRPELLPGLSDPERAILTEIRDIQAERARLTEGDLTRTIAIDGTPEVFDLPTARRITRAQQATASTREILAAREAVLSPGSLSRDDILSRLDDVERRTREGTISSTQSRQLSRLWMEALDEAGWEWRLPDGSIPDWDRISPDESARLTLTQVARPQMADLISALRPLARRYPTIPRLIDHLQNARWSSARKDLDAFASTRAGDTLIDTLPFDVDGLKAELSRLVRRDRVMSRTNNISSRTLEKMERAQARIEARSVPARFSTAVAQRADELIAARVKERYTGTPDLDRMLELAHQRIYDPISELTPNELRTLQRQARESWRALRDAGLDPIFFSRVTPAQRARIPYARVSDSPMTPAAAKARMFDATPYQTDMGVALTKDGLDLLQRRATDAFLDEFATTYGRTRAALVDELLPRAQARVDANPRLSIQTHLDNLINERWSQWDRSKYGGKRGKGAPAFPIEGRESVYVPRVMAENLDRLYTPPLPKLTAAFDPVMKVFRTSVLPLAPRWHIYNTIGGAVMTAASDPMAFRYLPQVIREMWGSRKSAGGPGADQAIHIEGAPPAGFGTLPPEARAWDHAVSANSPLRDRLAATHNYAAGRTLRKWWDEAREGRLGKMTDGFSRGIEASYNANQMVDDMYRSAIGISAKNRALRKGVSPEMADALAVSQIRRVFQSWDQMTPIERSIMRAVMPFYGWTAHIVRYALSYPFDHPIRVSILGSLSRAELEDSLTGLPDYIRDMVLIGDVRANGVVKALNVGPFNPFRDLPSQFTVAGFLGNLNPVLTGVLESVGVNVQQGGPSLYPETRYNPETGRLEADPSGNLVSNILGNVSPQLNLLTAISGRNESFNQLLARDPEAAGRQLLSNMGMPVFFRNIDVGEQLIRAEMARFQDQENVRREALKTGNLDMLGDFPGLAAYAEQVKALEGTGALDQLRPAPGALGTPNPAAGRAYAIQAALLARDTTETP